MFDTTPANLDDNLNIMVGLPEPNKLNLAKKINLKQESRLFQKLKKLKKNEKSKIPKK